MGCQGGDGRHEDTAAELLEGDGLGRVRVRSVQSPIGGQLQEIKVTWDKGPCFCLHLCSSQHTLSPCFLKHFLFDFCLGYLAC